MALPAPIVRNESLMLIPTKPAHGVLLLVAAFMGGHARPDVHAQVRITQRPHTVQLAKSFEPKGWWYARLPAFGGTYEITAHVPHAICSSVTLTIPPVVAPQQEGGRDEVRIHCER
jgi:hypothetical protein